MSRQEALAAYEAALRAGQKEFKALSSAGRDPYPAVLDQMISSTDSLQDLGTIEIPTELIVGVRSAGRIHAFTASFLPLLDPSSEFAAKWIKLCEAHLSDVGIREPVLCYEYLGKFYIQEGNKRVSVLRYFGAPRITATVRRVVVPYTDEPHVRAYHELLAFYQASGLYQIQFRRPGDYAKLLSHLGKDAGEQWSEEERRSFSSCYQYFRDGFAAVQHEHLDLLPEEALLLWLQVYPFLSLKEMTDAQIRKSIAQLWPDMEAIAQPKPVEIRTDAPSTEEKTGLINRIIASASGPLQVAFVHPMEPTRSQWINGHDLGRQHLEQAMGERITVRSYFHGDTAANAEAQIEQAVADGAQVVFTTTPQLSRTTLRMAVKYPRVRFLNCSVDTPYSSFRTYYCRIYEAKFITGAIAGAMANNDKIGYIASSPIFGVPASINAFALGARLTNPRAKIYLRWSCLPGNPQEDFLKEGMQVITNREVSTPEKRRMNFFSYGTYAMSPSGELSPLASPCWLWGNFYEKIIRSVLNGSWDKEQDTPRALNYWWGFDSDTIDVKLAPTLPEGCHALADILREGLRSGAIDPFLREIITQDGTVINDGTRSLTPDEILRMDWLCDNVIGSIPEFEELESFAQPMTRQLGIYRDRIPAEKEGTL